MKGYVHRTFSPAEGNGRIIARDDADTVILGYDESDGILVPNPARRKPKPGHWRVTPGAKLKPHVKTCGTTTIYNALTSGRVDGDYVREDMRRKATRRELRRNTILRLRAAGYDT